MAPESLVKSVSLFVRETRLEITKLCAFFSHASILTARSCSAPRPSAGGVEMRAVEILACKRMRSLKPGPRRGPGGGH